MDSPWEDIPNDNARREVEWARISTEFTNAGYREGITSGKESTLQEGFDAGFADFGVPLGRDLGMVRGLTSALLAVLQTATTPTTTTTTPTTLTLQLDIEKELITRELQDISSKLSRIRCSDVMPPDLEAEEHARRVHHLDDEEGGGESAAFQVESDEQLVQKRDMEGLEERMERMMTGEGDNFGTSAWSAGSSANTTRSTVEDTEVLKTRLKELAGRLGLKLDGIDSC